jgi:hypothetical protein
VQSGELLDGLHSFASAAVHENKIIVFGGCKSFQTVA